MLGRDKNILGDLINDAMQSFFDQHKGRTIMYVVSTWNTWRLACSRDPRPFESVILDGSLANELYEDAKQFFNNSKWYYDHGIPYRRGYLLYGSPGCGKTSLVAALAGKLKLNICVLTLSSGKLDDNRLNQLLHDAPADTLILLEDVDSVFVDRNTVTPESDRDMRVTFSGLLNAIDGVASQEVITHCIGVYCIRANCSL